MSSPTMISLEEGSEIKNVAANLLPCRIHHDGPVDPVGAYWKPVSNPDDSKEAYFRGRKLKGKTLPLPPGYRGVVVERAADELKKETPLSTDGQGAHDDDVVAMETVGAMRVTGKFDDMVIWSHESMATAAADPYIHDFEDENSDKTK
ncbi:ribonuclease H2 subunit C [Cordyceps javanica]|uniref:Ribonuclease H2 subunit C n=1 Tax=Cordyceps javanica TaxID=43265 RepID=A0A545VT90_9HYPO|nr:ribonuclease H2 subunit C [Cordyceps javanica]TQW04895.1 ribonuclease H2 subunit C [Cordyceps javanica]